MNKTYLMKLINDDKNLYASDELNYSKSLEFAKGLPILNNDKMIFHCYWRVPRQFERKQLAVLKSIITSHSNELDNIEINLWSNIDLSDNTYFKEVSDFVNLKIWDLQEELKGTLLENHQYLKKEYITDYMCYLESDLFRLLTLHKYGGFYIDMDVLVLRNMRPLNSYEFLYQWGTSGFSNPFAMNNAIMRLSKGSSLSLEFLRVLSQTQPIQNSTVWGSNMFSRINHSDLWILPCAWFNSGWETEDYISNDRCMINWGTVNLYDGAFTWHWHNKWDQVPEVGSKFQILEEKHNNIFQELNK